MKVGDYIRTKDGKIEKYSGTNDSEIENFTLNEIVKSSPNIIDLIEIGDYVNGRLVHDNLIYLTEFGWVDFDTLEQTDTRQIKSVVTHEQFEKMMYKIGD